MEFNGSLRRVGVLAAALGIGALTPAPWLAQAADTAPSAQDIDVWLAASGMDFDISIWGWELFPDSDATAVSTFGSVAIAIGDGAVARTDENASNFGDFAFANGAGSTAFTNGNFDYASVTGENSSAGAARNFSSATVIGDNSHANAFDGFSDHASVSGDHSTAGAFEGNNLWAYVFGDHSTAFAGSGNDISQNYNDFAAAYGDNLTADATGADNLYVVEPSSATDTTTAAVTAATTSDGFGLSTLLNELGLGGLVPGLDGLLAWF